MRTKTYNWCILYLKYFNFYDLGLYECDVNLAKNYCKCIPWDFLNNNSTSSNSNEIMEECDVFGRTCFFETMQKLSQTANQSCSHCLPECDYIHYNKVIQSDKTKPVTDLNFLTYINNIENR